MYCGNAIGEFALKALEVSLVAQSVLLFGRRACWLALYRAAERSNCSCGLQSSGR